MSEHSLTSGFPPWTTHALVRGSGHIVQATLRQGHPDVAPALGLGHPDRALVQVDDPPRDGQPEPGAAVHRGRAAAVEPVEDPPAIARVDAGSLVDDVQ